MGEKWGFMYMRSIQKVDSKVSGSRELKMEIMFFAKGIPFDKVSWSDRGTSY